MRHVGSITPAYGRDYLTEEDAVKAWNDGRDFVFHSVTVRYDEHYCSIRDFNVEDTLQLRYSKKRKVVIVNGSVIKPTTEEA